MKLQPIRLFLLPFAWLYGLAVGLRNLLFDSGLLHSFSFTVPVISVGNLTSGGTGKTTHIEYLVSALKDEYRLAVLSRGYKRKTRYFILVSGMSSVAEVGDEPLQLKKKFPELTVAVDRRRVHGIRRLMQTSGNTDLILLDDAFQHRYVNPGLSILIIDYNRPVFRDRLLPAGNLREPWRNAARADIFIISKCPSDIKVSERQAFRDKLKDFPGKPVFFTTYVYGEPVPVCKGKHKSKKHVITYKKLKEEKTCIFLVTGIANPKPLSDFLRQKLNLKDEMIFPDHHSYNEKDLAKIRRRWESSTNGKGYIFTTEKDATRFREIMIRDKQLKKHLYYVPVTVRFLAKGEKHFLRMIGRYLKKPFKSISL